MKTLLLVFVSAALAGPSLLAATPPTPAPASATRTAPRGPIASPAVGLIVNVPPSLRTLRDDDIANAIADNVLTGFQRDGFRGRFDYDFTEPSRPTGRVPRLELSLIEWRITPTHFVECTIAADLITSDGTRSLGLFSGTAILGGWLRDPFSSAEGFDDAARQAVDDLYHTLAEKNLLPDLITGI